MRELFQSLPEIGSAGNPHTCTARITLAVTPVMRKSPYAGMIFNGLGRPLNLDGVSATLPASMGGNKTPIMDEALLRDPSAEDWIREYHGRLRRGEIEGAAGPAPERLRRISIVESAAVQTFPRDYKFCGSNLYPNRERGSVPAGRVRCRCGRGSDFRQRRLHNEAECGKCKNHGVLCL